MSDSSGATLFLQIEKNAFSAEEFLKGKVCMSVTNEDGIKASSLRINLIGKEEVSVNFFKDDKNQNNKNKHIFLNIDHAAAKYPDECVGVGQYEYHFKARLPPGLPSTMYHKSEKCSCQIIYTLKAYLDTNGESINVTKNVNITAKPKGSEYLYGAVVGTPAISPINCCCNASIMLGAELDVGVISRGAIFEVGFACRNNSYVPLNNAEVKVKEDVFYQIEDRKEHHKRTVANVIIASTEIQEFCAKDNRDFLLNKLQTSKLFISGNTNNSYEGTLFQVRHRVTVKIKTKTGCSFFVNNPKVTMPVYVQTGEIHTAPLLSNSEMIEEESENRLPSDWNPKEACNVIIPSADIVGPHVLLYSSFDIDPSKTPFHKMMIQMKSTFDPYTLITKLSTSPTYQRMLMFLTPNEYANILCEIKCLFDVPRCARLMAEIMGNWFRCAHVSMACTKTSPLLRTNIINATASLTCDFKGNSVLIEHVLNDFEWNKCQDVLGY